MQENQETILIADVGSTSASWALCTVDGKESRILRTDGFNPLVHSEKLLERLRQNVINFVADDSPSQIYYYGSGVISLEVSEMISKYFKAYFEDAQIEVHSDMLGAAKACCDQNVGTVCILGTGSNSSIFDGTSIIKTTVSLGYPLGDEGSGWRIGLALIQGYYYDLMPEELKSDFGELLPDSRIEFIEYIKQSPTPNRYLGSFAKFAAYNQLDPWIKDVIVVCFNNFVKTHIIPLDPKAEVHFVGSIAWFFRDILEEVLLNHNIRIGKILEDPLDALIKYHLTL